MPWYLTYPRTVLLTVLFLEAVLLLPRLRRRESRAEHLCLFLLVVCLAVDELAPTGVPSSVAGYAVAVAAGGALAPRRRITLALVAAGTVSALLTLTLWATGWRNGPGPVILASGLLCALCAVAAAVLSLETHWMGKPVAWAVFGGGLVWLAGRVAGHLSLAVPAPALPLALVIGLAVVTWWFLPDGPASRRWYDYAARLEGRLVTAEGQLTRRDRLEALGLLAAGAAHEYRNTLSGIGALARWARGAPGTGAKDSALEGIVERADGSLRSVAWFLEGLSTQGREQPRPMRLAADLEGLLGFVRATCRRDGTTVLFEAAGDPGVVTRPSEIEHVLLNLLHNAARAVARTGRGERRITVRAAGSDGGAVIEVEDSGGGVPEEVVPRLFSPVATGAGGAGVGLYLARSLAERNGGGIEYEPVAGGSIFRLTLPERADSGEP